MGMHITSKALRPAIGALGVALIAGMGMGGCGHHPRLSNQFMSPSSAQFEVGNTLK